jgi:hypothetical protein
MTTAFSSVREASSSTRVRMPRSPTPKYVRYAALMLWGRITTATAPRVGRTRAFSNPGILTSSVASGGTCSSLKPPSASVRDSAPATMIEAPASGLRSPSSTRPATVGDGHGCSETGSTGFHRFGWTTGGATSGRSRAGSTGALTDRAETRRGAEGAASRGAGGARATGAAGATGWGTTTTAPTVADRGVGFARAGGASTP